MLGPVRIPHMTWAPTVLYAITIFEAEIVHDPFVPTPGRARPEERRTGVELRSWGGYEKRRREREGECCARVFCQDETIPSLSNLPSLWPRAGRMAHERGCRSAPFSNRASHNSTLEAGDENSQISQCKHSPRAAQPRTTCRPRRRPQRRASWAAHSAAWAGDPRRGSSGLVRDEKRKTSR